MGPLVTVLISARNAAGTLGNAIGSIVRQSLTDIEIILINDGSTDETETVIRSWDDPRIRYVRNPTNIGLTASLNGGLRIARGSFIARLDADDVADPGRLAVQAAFLQKSQDYVIVGSSVRTFCLRTGRTGYAHLPETDREIRHYLLAAPPFAHPAVMFRADVVRSIGLYYDESMRYAQDYDFWIRILRHGLGYNFSRPLTTLGMGPGQIGVRHHQAQATTAVEKAGVYFGETLRMSGEERAAAGSYLLSCLMAEHAALSRLRRCKRVLNKILWADRDVPSIGKLRVLAGSRGKLASLFVFSPVRERRPAAKAWHIMCAAVAWPTGLALAAAYRLRMASYVSLSRLWRRQSSRERVV